MSSPSSFFVRQLVYSRDSSCSGHAFVQVSTLQGTSLHCQRCRVHLEWKHSFNGPCASPRDARLNWHHLHSNQSNPDSWHCCGCKIKFQYHLATPLVRDLKQGLDDLLLKHLAFLLKDYLDGQRKPINSQNATLAKSMTTAG